MERIAAHCETCSPWWSRTIRTARARTSGEYGGTRFVMAPSSQELEPPGNPGRFTPRTEPDVRLCRVAQPLLAFAPTEPSVRRYLSGLFRTDLRRIDHLCQA